MYRFRTVRALTHTHKCGSLTFASALPRRTDKIEHKVKRRRKQQQKRQSDSEWNAGDTILQKQQHKTWSSMNRFFRSYQVVVVVVVVCLTPSAATRCSQTIRDSTCAACYFFFSILLSFDFIFSLIDGQPTSHTVVNKKITCGMSLNA